MARKKPRSPFPKAKDDNDPKLWTAITRANEALDRTGRERACAAKAPKGKICVHERIAKYNKRLRSGCVKVPFVKGAYACSPKAIERGATDAPERGRRSKKRSTKATKRSTKKGACVKFKKVTRCYKSVTTARKAAKMFKGRLLAR